MAYAVVGAIHIGMFSRAASMMSLAGIFALGRRKGLMVVLVAIGESVVAIGVGLSDLPVDPPLVAVAVAILGLGRSTCLWWACFHDDDTRAEHALAHAPPASRSMMAIEGYGHAHLAILLGVVAVAAADASGAHHPFEPLATGRAVSLGAGAALYLAGNAWFRQRLRIADPRPRLAAALQALATIPLGIDIATTAQLAALVAIFLALFVTEARRAADTRCGVL